MLANYFEIMYEELTISICKKRYFFVLTVNFQTAI